MTIVAFYRDNKLQLHHAMQPAIDELKTAINTQRDEALIKLVQKALNELGLFVSGLKIWLSPEQKETLQNIANHFKSTGLNKKITKPIEMLLIKTAMAEADAAGY